MVGLARGGEWEGVGDVTTPLTLPSASHVTEVTSRNIKVVSRWARSEF